MKAIRNPAIEKSAHAFRVAAAVIALLTLAFSSLALSCEPHEQKEHYEQGAVDVLVYCVNNGSISAGDLVIVCLRGQKM